MELQFHKTVLQYLQPVIRQAQTQEQTQEVRLPEGMPDIGRVVTCWAQVIVRGKEWRSDRIGVNGGVMTWVLYLPEEGGAPQSVAAWLPFQMKWDIPQTRHDGTIQAQPYLRSVDARSLSARKLMVRANFSMLVQAMVPGETELYTPEELPQDVRVLKRSYPMQIPMEAGEKAFSLEEEFTVSAASPQPEQLIRYELRPELVDRKLMADKVVFRGAALIHALYRCADGQLHNWDQEISFSQFADLDREYDSDASVQVLPLLTNLELDLMPEGKLCLKASLSGQYAVYGRPMVEVVEDAYSPLRTVAPQIQMLQLPSVLDAQTQTQQVEQTVEADAAVATDLAFYPDVPQQMYSGDGVQIQLPGVFSLLYKDTEGNLQSTNAYWEEMQMLSVPELAQLQITVAPSGAPQMILESNGVSMQADILTDRMVVGGQGLPMVTGLVLGEQTQPDPGRPSLILRKAGGDSLWELAKAAGSTVEDILSANGLTGEPEPGQMLLIPVP